MLSKLSYSLLNDPFAFTLQNEVNYRVEGTSLKFLIVATKNGTSYQVLVITLPLLKFEISQCKESNHLQSLVVVKIRSLVKSWENIILKGSEVFAFEEHAGYFLFDSILSPLLEHRLNDDILPWLYEVLAGLLIEILSIFDDTQNCLDFIKNVAFKVFSLFVPERHLLDLSKSFKNQSHLIVVERHVVLNHSFLLMGSLVPSIKLLLNNFVLTLVERRL